MRAQGTFPEWCVILADPDVKPAVVVDAVVVLAPCLKAAGLDDRLSLEP